MTLHDRLKGTPEEPEVSHRPDLSEMVPIIKEKEQARLQAEEQKVAERERQLERQSVEDARAIVSGALQEALKIPENAFDLGDLTKKIVTLGYGQDIEMTKAISVPIFMTYEGKEVELKAEVIKGMRARLLNRGLKPDRTNAYDDEAVTVNVFNSKGEKVLILSGRFEAPDKELDFENPTGKKFSASQQPVSTPSASFPVSAVEGLSVLAQTLRDESLSVDEPEVSSPDLPSSPGDDFLAR
jgi:hypothetical protein